MPEQEAQPKAPITNKSATKIPEAGMGSAVADTAADRQDYNNETANEDKKETIAEKEKKSTQGLFSTYDIKREAVDANGLERPTSVVAQLDPSSIGGGASTGKTHRVQFSGEYSAAFSEQIRETSELEGLNVEDLNANMGNMMLIESITGNSMTGKKVDASTGVGTAKFSKDEQIPAIFNAMKAANLIPAGKNFSDLLGAGSNPAQQMQTIKNLMMTHIGNQPGAGNQMDVAQVRFYENFVDTQIQGFSNDATANQEGVGGSEAEAETSADRKALNVSIAEDAIQTKLGKEVSQGLSALAGYLPEDQVVAVNNEIKALGANPAPEKVLMLIIGKIPADKMKEFEETDIGKKTRASMDEINNKYLENQDLDSSFADAESQFKDLDEKDAYARGVADGKSQAQAKAQEILIEEVEKAEKIAFSEGSADALSQIHEQKHAQTVFNPTGEYEEADENGEYYSAKVAQKVFNPTGKYEEADENGEYPSHKLAQKEANKKKLIDAAYRKGVATGKRQAKGKEENDNSKIPANPKTNSEDSGFMASLTTLMAGFGTLASREIGNIYGAFKAYFNNKDENKDFFKVFADAYTKEKANDNDDGKSVDIMDSLNQLVDNKDINGLKTWFKTNGSNIADIGLDKINEVFDKASESDFVTNAKSILTDWKTPSLEPEQQIAENKNANSKPIIKKQVI